MSETALLRATRDRIRTVSGYDDRQITVEIDERAPATSGKALHIIVMTGGTEAGPIHASGGVVDKVYGVDISIALRSPVHPRDRQAEDMWLATADSFSTAQRNIEEKVDMDYTLLTAANVFITSEEPVGMRAGFIEPLVFAGLGPIREAPAEIFAGTPGGTPAALIRTIRFRGARRVEARAAAYVD